MYNNSLFTIGVVVALSSEAKTLKNVTDRITPTLSAKAKIVTRQSGIGLKAARRQAEYLAEISGLLVSFGISGGLHPALKTGDLILSDQVLSWNPEYDSVKTKTQNDKLGLHKLSSLQTLSVNPRTDIGIIDSIAKKFQENAIHFYQGPLLCSPKPLMTKTSKLSARQLTGALAVDTESRAVYEVAKEAKLPFFCLRSVCDPADQSVADALLTMVNEKGDANVGCLLSHLVRSPWMIKDIIIMTKQFRRALISLEKAWLLVAEIFLSAGDTKSVISPVLSRQQ
jgi:nucleoside phosphorylase